MGERHRGPGTEAWQQGGGGDVLSPEGVLGLGPDSHSPMGKGFELSYSFEVLFTYNALCVCL